MKKEITVFNDSLSMVAGSTDVYDTKAQGETLGLFCIRSFCPNPELLRYPCTRVLNQDKPLPRAEQSVPVDLHSCLTVVEAIPHIHSCTHTGLWSYSDSRPQKYVAFDSKEQEGTRKPFINRTWMIRVASNVIGSSTESRFEFLCAQALNSDYCEDNNTLSNVSNRLGEIRATEFNDGFVLN